MKKTRFFGIMKGFFEDFMAQILTSIASLLQIPIAHAQANLNANNVATETQGEISKLVEFIVGQIPLWITALIVFVLTFIIAKIVKSSVENKLTKEGFEEENKEVTILAARTANAAVLIVGITVALKIAGIDLTAIIAAGAFGVGFALQDIIMNFIAGVMILSARHYSIGDVIKVDGILGKIVEIQTRATILKAFDGTRVVVPNATLFKNTVTSLTSNPFRRITLINGVGYGADLKKTSEVVLKAVGETEGLLAVPKPSIVFYEWGDYSINFRVNAWVESHSPRIKIRNKMLMNMQQALDASGIPIPYPTQSIELEKNSEDEQDEKIEELIASTPERSGGASPDPKLISAPVKVSEKAPAKIDTEAVPAAAWLKKAATSSRSEDAVPAPQRSEGASSPTPLIPNPIVPIPQAIEPKPIAGITPTPPNPTAV